MRKSITLAGMISLLVAGHAMAEQTRQWRFHVFFDDTPIGYHTFTLSGSRSQRVLTSQADFMVKILFIEAYSYEHSATEHWSGDCLQRMLSVSNDNGEKYRVDGEWQGDKFVIDTRQGSTQLAGCVMSFAYWNPAILQQDQLLNPQNGEYVKVTVRSLGHENLRLGDQTIPSERYLLNADGRRITLWYSSADRRWLGLQSVTEDGHTIRYELLQSAARTSAARLSQRL
jgi:hypothetical protein